MITLWTAESLTVKSGWATTTAVIGRLRDTSIRPFSFYLGLWSRRRRVLRGISAWPGLLERSAQY